MALVEPLIEIAKASGCSDLAACRNIVQAAAEEQRSLIHSILESRLVDETGFLKGVSRWLGDSLVERTDHRRARAVAGEGAGEDCSSLPMLFLCRKMSMESGSHFTIRSTCWRDRLWPHRCTSESFTRCRHAPRSFRRSGRAMESGPRHSKRSSKVARRKSLGLDMKQETNVLDLDDSEASVVKFVNQILREALEQRATDIHIEPLQDDLQIRYRIDGVLHDVPVPPNIKVLQASVISRLKIMAHLDIAERRLPQDGRINLELDAQAIDVRVATIPSVAGESISLRLLGQERFTFDRLGLDKAGANTDSSAPGDAERYRAPDRADRLRQIDDALHVSIESEHEGAPHCDRGRSGRV